MLDIFQFGSTFLKGHFENHIVCATILHISTTCFIKGSLEIITGQKPIASRVADENPFCMAPNQIQVNLPIPDDPQQ